MATIQSNLSELRQKRSLSAIQLAATVGISRQTIYAIEGGTYVPNTAVALRLARALGATVEELFTLENVPAKVRSQQAVGLPGSGDLRAGQAVQLCRLDRKLVASPPSAIPWCLPAADAVVLDEKGRVQAFQDECEFTNRILVAGCDPGISVLSRHAQSAGIELVLAQRNSTQALALLKDGCVHVAGTHLVDEVSGESNLPQVRKLFPKNSAAIVSFAVWEEGIVTAAANPKKISGVEDFARRDVSIVNREEGAGIRVLLDKRLKQAGIEPRRVRGYELLVTGHLHAAWHVHSGAADCCLATRAAARLFGLHFIPLVSERYDLVIRRQHMELPRIQNLLDMLTRSGFRRELEGFGGYDAKAAGERVL